MRGQSRDYPAFPSIEATIGYNPARFLDSTIERTDRTTDLTVKSLIRGIDDIETLRAWIEVEVDLGRADGGPRREIIKWLNRRQAQIESNDAAAPSTTAESDVATTSTMSEETTAADAERARDEEPSEPAPDAPETASNGTSTTASDNEPISDPTCPVCGEDLVAEEIAGQLGQWCCECRGFREPQTAPSTGATQEDPVLADGGEETTPKCSECRGVLTPEEVGDETAHWCAHCGGFREPLRGAA